MEKNNLYSDLKNTYNEENLNKITRRLINSYRDKEFDYIHNLIQNLGGFIGFGDCTINKAFSRLVMLYHPDKLKFYQNEIENYYKKGEEIKLNQLSHIFITLKNLNTISNRKPMDSIQTSARSEDYGYDVDINDFDHIVDSVEDEFEQENIAEDFTHDFLSALTLREFSNLDTEIQPHHLESLTGDLDFSRCGINDLTGIENCINISSLNFSNNVIVDITNLGYLTLLEEIYMSNNEIDSVDGLSNLHNLQIVDLSSNNIDDISPLYDLPKLHYLNIVGNQVTPDQMDLVSKKGRIIIF
jgi:Leucine-rich repeat (LRR) protein